MKRTKNLIKIISVLLILVLCLPFVFACGEKADNGGAAADKETNDSTGSPATEAAAPVTQATEPTTERETQPPTEAPTDPAELPAPDTIGDYEIIPGARYYLWSPNSNLYMTVDGDFKYAGLSQEDYTGTPDQMFVFEKLREEVNADTGVVTIFYKMKALGTKNSYVDIEDGAEGNSADGQAVIVSETPESEGSHEWVLKAQKKTKMTDDDTKELIDDFADVDLPIFSITNPVGKKRCLDINGVSKSSGGTVHMWSGGTANNQKWFFELVADVESGKIIPRGLWELDY